MGTTPKKGFGVDLAIAVPRHSRDQFPAAIITLSRGVMDAAPSVMLIENTFA
jgi:hypothetical protein